jgi:hypothetical protein
MYWLSGRARNDLFLLYCFADSGRPTTELRALVARRSARIADLRVRLRISPPSNSWNMPCRERIGRVCRIRSANYSAPEWTRP